MRLLVVATRFVPGKTYGAEVYFKHMLKAVLREIAPEDEVVIAANMGAFAWMTETFIDRHKAPENIKVDALSVPKSTIRALVYEQFALPRMANKHGCDVVFFPFNLMPVFGNLFRRVGPRTVLMVHDLVSFFYLKHFSEYRPAFYRLQAWILKRSINKAGAIIVPTQAMADDLSTHFPGQARKVRVIHEAAPPLLGDPASIELPTAWQQAPHLLLQSGAKLPHKSQNTSLEALAYLKRNSPKLYDDICLVITGGNNDEQAELRSAIERFGVQDAVEVAGRLPRETLEALSARAKLHLFPTLYEGFGLGIAEAICLGKNFVASDLPVLREVSHGQGVFFEPGNAVSMANALGRALCQSLSPTRAPGWVWSDHARALIGILREQVQN